VRLYRGLKNPYRPERVDTSRPGSGTDFTDCPAMALLYADGARGVVLVVDIDPDQALGTAKLTKELWLVRNAKRFMIWGRFDEFLTATFPAEDLRAQLRRVGLRNARDEDKAVALRGLIARELRDREFRAACASRTDSAAGAITCG